LWSVGERGGRGRRQGSGQSGAGVVRIVDCQGEKLGKWLVRVWRSHDWSSDGEVRIGRIAIHWGTVFHIPV
jgi:hypothetical protein